MMLAHLSGAGSNRVTNGRYVSATCRYFHDLLNGVGKEAVMADIQSWIEAHLWLLLGGRRRTLVAVR